MYNFNNFKYFASVLYKYKCHLNDSQRHLNSVNSLASLNIEISSTDESSRSFYSVRSINSTLSRQIIFISDSTNNGKIESKVSNGTHSQKKSNKHWTSNYLVVV